MSAFLEILNQGKVHGIDDYGKEICLAEFETIKKLILLQFRRIEEAETFEETKVINKELMSALR